MRRPGCTQQWQNDENGMLLGIRLSEQRHTLYCSRQEHQIHHISYGKRRKKTGSALKQQGFAQFQLQACVNMMMRLFLQPI
jgi:hypothetical protein